MAVALILLALVAGCTSDDSSNDDEPGSSPANTDLLPNQLAGVPIPDGRVDDAVAKLDGLVDKLMKETGIPGMSVAVVHKGKSVYAKGFGVRDVQTGEQVTPDTVFQLASVSKSVAATVVAREVEKGTVTWETPAVSKLPWFALADPYVTANVTVGDLFSHRSGLPDHAGDRLEDLGYDRRQVLERLRQEPLDPFRISYHYTNFGLTAGAEAVAAAAGTDWATLSQRELYEPLGMGVTSSRHSDFMSRANRAVGHIRQDGKWVVNPMQRQPDAQSPAGGVSSSVNDMTKWLIDLLADDDSKGLLPALTPQARTGPIQSVDARASFYGYGFNTGVSASGRTMLSHSGAFALGAATSFAAIPSADVAIIALTNAFPIGVAETLANEFSDLVQFGEPKHDWWGLFTKIFEPFDNPEGSLAGTSRPSNPAPAQPISSYVGVYRNPFWGDATITERDGALELALGTTTRVRLQHWDANTFTYPLTNENAPPGSIVKVDFAGNTATLDYYDEDGLGKFTK